MRQSLEQLSRAMVNKVCIISGVHFFCVYENSSLVVHVLDFPNFVKGNDLKPAC